LLDEVASELRQFIPPDTRMRDTEVVTELTAQGLVFAEAVAECAARGWDPDTWSRARAAAVKADDASLALEAAEDQVVDLGNDVTATCKLCLGLPAEQLLDGDGVAFTSRLAAAARTAGLADFDRRLRRQARHLIGPEQSLDDKLRRHLATLAISERPLLSHRATTQSLELVSRAIAGDPASAHRSIAEHVSLEPTALSTHRAQQDANRRLRQAQHAEDRMRPIADMYSATADGDIVRTAKVVLALLGKTLPPRSTLAAARDLLRTQAAQPLCALLASTIRPEWRNAIAHEQIEWNDVQNTAVFAGNQVDLDDVLDLANQPRLICQGFERAVAVAYARTPPPVAASTRVSARLVS
jgi:cell division septum initiation protein DivIVA